ncbi:hypothetical protein, partial [Stenotrophomonas maltophilia]
ATWSNLPISGSFVDMLHRIVTLSRNTGPSPQENGAGASRAFPPYLTLNAEGALTPPGADAKPLILKPGETGMVSFD